MNRTRQDLLEALTLIQNHPAHSHHDILTITGCGMTDDEIRAHLEVSMQQVSRWSEETPIKARKTRSSKKVAA